MSEQFSRRGFISTSAATVISFTGCLSGLSGDDADNWRISDTDVLESPYMDSVSVKPNPSIKEIVFHFGFPETLEEWPTDLVIESPTGADNQKGIELTSDTVWIDTGLKPGEYRVRLLMDREVVDRRYIQLEKVGDSDE